MFIPMRSNVCKVLLVIGAIFFLGAINASAGTYYVSNSGSAPWGSATNINTPCSISTAFANARAGDIINFRGGTYNVPAKNFGNTYHGYYEPSYSGTSNACITFQAYPGETPILNGTAGGSGDQSEYATIFGTNGRDFITFDGFTFVANNGVMMARFYVGSDTSDFSDYITIKNCVFNGGETPVSHQDNHEGLRMERTNHLAVSNCIFYNYKASSTYYGIGAIKGYTNNYTTIENCEIYDCTHGIYAKSSCNNQTYRYNYIHDTLRAILITTHTSSVEHDANNISIYHNLIVNNGYQGIQFWTGDSAVANDAQIFNNTIYNVNQGLCVGACDSGHGAHVYNNIVHNCPNKGYDTDYNLRMRSGGQLDECDYNQYGNITFYNIASTSASSLNAWRSLNVISPSGNPDAHGMASDPRFVNLSGTLSQIRDFALRADSPCKGAGKNGADMGANISLVGPGIEVPDQETDRTPPAEPTGINVQTQIQ